MWKIRLVAGLVLALGAGLGWFVYSSEVGGSRPFKLGLDLSGGTQLIYRADLSAIETRDVAESMAALRDTIERRVNLFGVAEPIVQTERGGALAGETEERLIVELPGVTDTEEAIRLIGQTPVLEFRMLKDDQPMPATGVPVENVNEVFEPAAITGRHLASAQIQFDQSIGARPNDPIVALSFNSEGAQIFAELTRDNVGKFFGIFLDGVPISIPVIREAIPGGTAVISGNFLPQEARELARNLNLGALPVPIELISTQTIGSTLGEEAVERGVVAALWGVALVALFMLLWYRLPGFVAILALTLYILIMLALFKFVPVTLTAAGLAGFILSVGMAVDANVLIFERIREELASGKGMHAAIRDGFARAWLAVRDGNISSVITAVILFWFGTSLVEGFALVFGIGVIVSMLTAIIASRTLLLALSSENGTRILRTLFGSGFSRSSKLEARS